MAIDNDVDVVGASSLAAGHRTLIPEMIEALEGFGASRHQGCRGRGHSAAGLCDAPRRGRARRSSAPAPTLPTPPTRCCACSATTARRSTRRQSEIASQFAFVRCIGIGILHRADGILMAGLALAAGIRISSADVQENPDRQSRGDCVPGDPHRAAHGHQDGRRLFRRRRSSAARENGRRGGSARARRRRPNPTSRPS